MKATYLHYNITATYKGDKAAPWSDNDKFGPNCNRHLVTVYNRNTKKRISFDFWASHAEPELRKRYDVLNAFYCFVSDAISGKEDFEEFCSNFGYDTDSRTAERIHKACQRSYDKALKVIDGDIYDLANASQQVAA